VTKKNDKNYEKVKEILESDKDSLAALTFQHRPLQETSLKSRMIKRKNLSNANSTVI